MTALQRTYGASFLQREEVRSLCAYDSRSSDGMAQGSSWYKKPLSARAVKQVLHVGDQLLLDERRKNQFEHNYTFVTLSRNGLDETTKDKQEIFKLSYKKDSDKMRLAAERFARHVAFAEYDADNNTVGSALLKMTTVYINRPTTENANTLAKMPGGEAALNFAKLYGISESHAALNTQTLTSSFKSSCSEKLGLKPDDVTIATNSHQFVMRLFSLSESLAKHASERADRGDNALRIAKNRFKQELQDIVSYIQAQTKTLETVIDGLSKHDVYKNVSAQDAKNLAWLKTDATIRLNDLLDPDGLGQQMQAFAIDALSDSDAAFDKVKNQIMKSRKNIVIAD